MRGLKFFNSIKELYFFFIFFSTTTQTAAATATHTLKQWLSTRADGCPYWLGWFKPFVEGVP